MLVRGANAGPWGVWGEGWAGACGRVVYSGGASVVDYVSGRVRGLWLDRHLGPLATFIPHVN